MDRDYPIQERRLRQNNWIRELVQEHRVSTRQLIQPLFVVEGISEREPVPGITGTYRETENSILSSIENDLKSGIHKFLLFGVPKLKGIKDFKGDFLSKQIKKIRKSFGKDLFLMVDLCLCSSTSHGQCGILNFEEDHIENAATVKALAQLAVRYAQSGADGVAPSDMMDSRVLAIRLALSQANLDRTLLMSYSAKFHSKFYGPFRVAADSAPKGGGFLKDRSTYQLDPASPQAAFACSLRDAQEGADILMVKPGLPYLDILFRLSKEIKKPWAVYEVSGEFAAIELLSQNGFMKASEGHLEAWTGFLRAGASMIITYGARYAKDYLRETE